MAGFDDDDDDGAIELGSSAFLPVDRGAKPPPPPRPKPRPAGGGAGAVPWLLFVLSAALAILLALYVADERARMRHALSASRDEAAELRRSLFSTQERLGTLQRDVAGKDQTLGAMQTALAQKGQETESNAKLIAELKSKLDTKDGDVSQDANRVAVNLTEDILFKSGDAELSARGKDVLTRLGTVLKGLDKQIVIGGHTDDRRIHTAQFRSNWELSSARAVNVVHHLIDVAGVDGRHLAAAGYSEFHPRSKAKAKNRRIEIALTPFR